MGIINLQMFIPFLTHLILRPSPLPPIPQPPPHRLAPPPPYLPPPTTRPLPSQYIWIPFVVFLALLQQARRHPAKSPKRLKFSSTLIFLMTLYYAPVLKTIGE